MRTWTYAGDALTSLNIRRETSSNLEERSPPAPVRREMAIDAWEALFRQITAIHTKS